MGKFKISKERLELLTDSYSNKEIAQMLGTNLPRVVERCSRFGVKSKKKKELERFFIKAFWINEMFPEIPDGKVVTRYFQWI